MFVQAYCVVFVSYWITLHDIVSSAVMQKSTRFTYGVELKLLRLTDMSNDANSFIMTAFICLLDKNNYMLLRVCYTGTFVKKLKHHGNNML